VACAVVVASAAGCVSRGIHDDVVSERDRLDAENRVLSERVKVLEASTTSLQTELDATLEQFEDLSVAHKKLTAEARRLRETEARLSDELADQSIELVRSREQLDVARSELERLTSTYTTLMSDLESEVSAGQIQIEQLREGIRVNVSDDILFASGSAKLDPVGRRVLEKVAAQLAGLEHDVEVQGHTDDRKITGSLKERYATNWELAAARAARVARLLQDEGISGDRLSVVSFASYRPIAPNDTPEDRALNRRIEIRLKPKDRPVSDAALAAPPEDAPAGSR
jgi:chemotaxis protein MotB